MLWQQPKNLEIHISILYFASFGLTFFNSFRTNNTLEIGILN